MSKKLLCALLVLFVAGWVAGCQTTPAPVTGQAFTPQGFAAGEYIPKVDNFLVLFDRSQSMQAGHQGQAKLDIGKEVVRRMNHTLPAFDFTGGLRSFGKGSCCGDDQTDMLYGMARHDTAGLDQALMGITSAGGNTPLAGALGAAGDDLQGVQGPIALIVVSDGQNQDNAPVTAAQALKQTFGDRLCITTVQVGDDPAGAALLNQIADAGGCGFATNADQIMSPAGMAGFVEKVFLAKAAPKPAPVRLDSDGDGVYDDQDKCPNTPTGAQVDSRGCWVLAGVRFDTDKSDIKPEYYPILDEVVAILQNNQSLQLAIEGHTDNRGSAEYNQRLSEDRAESVMNYLVSNGIDGSRLSSRGYGFSQPAATNETAAGRQLNRRVELRPID